MAGFEDDLERVDSEDSSRERPGVIKNPYDTSQATMMHSRMDLSYLLENHLRTIQRIR
jgi:hypothetical protein